MQPTVPTVQRSIDVDAAPDDLWRLVAEPDELATWFAVEADLDLSPGGAGRFVDDEGTVRRAVVDAVDPGRRLVLRWWPEDHGQIAASVVTITVAPRAGGARLVVTEQLAAPAGATTVSAGVRAAAAAAIDAWQWRLDLLLLRVTAVARV